jgi:nucleoside-diphosphate-sugar epimerase
MKNTPRNVLVTGAAGYLGSIAVPELLKQGHRVTAVDNFMYGQSSLLDVCYNPNLDVVRGDVRNATLMKKLMAKADAIIPLACLVGAPVCEQKPVEARTINLDAIKMLLDMSSKEQMFVVPVTNSGYGIGQQGIYCTEETPLNPISVYGKLKSELEQHLMASGHAISLRLATAFGISPRMRLDLLVNEFTYRACIDRFIVLFEAHFKRNYVHVRDIAAAFIHCMENFDAMKNQAYNVGLSEANLSKMELCLEIKKQVPDFAIMESPIGEDPDKRNYIVSNEKIEKTGFKAKVQIEQGIAELVKGYKVIRRNQYSNV